MKRYFIIYYTYQEMDRVGFGISKYITENGKHFNCKKFSDKTMSEGFRAVMVIGFNELSKSDFEDFITH